MRDILPFGQWICWKEVFAGCSCCWCTEKPKDLRCQHVHRLILWTFSNKIRSAHLKFLTFSERNLKSYSQSTFSYTETHTYTHSQRYAMHSFNTGSHPLLSPYIFFLCLCLLLVVTHSQFVLPLVHFASFRFFFSLLHFLNLEEENWAPLSFPLLRLHLVCFYFTFWLKI